MKIIFVNLGAHNLFYHVHHNIILGNNKNNFDVGTFFFNLHGSDI